MKMAFESVKAALGEVVLKEGLRYLARDPEKNMVKLVKWWGEKIARSELHKNYAKSVVEFLLDENNNWRQLAVRAFRQLSPKVRDTLISNFFIDALVLSPEEIRKAQEKYGVHVPPVMLFDLTERCNLRCKGCWAAEFPREDLDFATLDRILTEAEGLGMRFLVVSGGEPTVRKNDLLDLAKKHSKDIFHVYTNGTLIDKEFARKVAEVGNIAFAISIDGLEENTNLRRGKGVFRKVMEAMDNLWEAGAAFGFSTTYTRQNTEEIASDAFIDLMIEKGCLWGWLFTYIPTGGAPDLQYMATPEQRGFMYQTLQRWRREKPIFVIDFWNDGNLVGGCIAGGRSYFHINAAGDVEPCAFVHYANVNIKKTTLVEALKSPLFMAYQANQPFNSNHLRPCPIIDNPQKLEKIVNETGAYPTQRNGISVSQLCQPLYGYAQEWGAVADQLWEETASAQEAVSFKGGRSGSNPDA
jgi:MoaA/NifB/PqqE/SkfB family radical SAM enzyme